MPSIKKKKTKLTNDICVNKMVRLLAACTENIFDLCSLELYYDRGNHHEFTSLVRELARPGELSHTVSYDFEFVQVEKPYESYTGANVKLRFVCVLNSKADPCS